MKWEHRWGSFDWRSTPARPPPSSFSEPTLDRTFWNSAPGTPAGGCSSMHGRQPRTPAVGNWAKMVSNVKCLRTCRGVTPNFHFPRYRKIGSF